MTSSSSGLLLYAALVDLLAEDFLSEEANRLLSKKDKISAFCWVLAGGECPHPKPADVGHLTAP